MTEQDQLNNISTEIIQLRESLKSMIEITTNQLDSHQNLLEKHTEQLDLINKSLSNMKVQDEKIQNLEKQINKLCNTINKSLDDKDKKIEKLEGIITKITEYQATCPRNNFTNIKDQIRYLWVVIIPMGLTHIGLLLAVLSFVFGGK